METQIESIMDKVMSNSHNTGCLFANNQGLCLGARGNGNAKSAGLIVAISEQASKLHPNSNSPVISLEVGNKQCLIHKYGITGAVYKKN